MKPIRRERCDISSDKRFTDEFKKYVAEQKYVATRLLVDGDLVLEFEHADSLTSAEYRRFVDEVIRLIETKFSGLFGCLIQFWRAEEEIVLNNSAGERRFLLTLRNQPFLLEGSLAKKKDGVCLYRTKMYDVILNGDGRGGAIGRVFRNNRMEFTPNVLYYSDKEEYPQLDIALSCNIGCSLVLPWRDSFGRVVGVIEFVSPLGVPLISPSTINLLLNDSLFSGYCIRLCGQYDLEKDSLINAVTEIKEVIGQLCERGYIDCAQTWMVCKNCNSLSTVKRCAEELTGSSKNFIGIGFGTIFLGFQDYDNLQKGEGVVGKAAESSHDLVYCEDVAKFGITKYPLAHFARDYGLSASFAICLKSNQTGDQAYVLELFLHPDYVKGKNLSATLVPILETMRQRFKTIKFASIGEIGDSLSVQIIDASFSEKNDTFKICGLDLMDNHLAYAISMENERNMASNPNERESAITALTEKLHNAQKLGDRGRESAIGATDAEFSKQKLFVANFVSTAEKEKAVMQQKLISNDGTDVSRFFPEDFNKYVCEENLLYPNIERRFWVFSKERESGVVGYDLRDLVDGKFDSIIGCLEECLVQFWIVEEPKLNQTFQFNFGGRSERLVQLESRNQPFFLIGSDTYNGICTYRIKMSDSVVGNGGVIGRVYRNNRMEYSPDIGYYSSEEYPHQDLAKS